MDKDLRVPAIDPETVPEKIASGYPGGFDDIFAGLQVRRLGNALGLRNFGVNLVRMPPGAGSAQRHWHSLEDEFVYVLEGELTLITDAGPQVLSAGMAAGFPAGNPDGHHLINRGAEEAVYLEVGDRRIGDEVVYPDVDLFGRMTMNGFKFSTKEGEPY